MIKFQFGEDADDFELDPVAYAPALGDTGMAEYRTRLAEIRATLSQDPGGLRDPDRHARWVLEWNDKRLAVLDHNVEEIIRTHAHDRKVAAWFQDTAEALEEIGEIDLAIDWARQALNIGPRHQSLNAADYWCKLLAEHRPTEEFDARLTVFRRWPSPATAARLHEAASDAWASYGDEVMAVLSARPADIVSFALFTLKDPRRAWDIAHSLALDDDRTWAELVKSYEKIDPIATLPIQRRLVERELIDAGAQHYRLAARRLAKMRKLSAESESAVEVDGLIADLREIHRRRPRLQQEFDRAGLP
jgi:hypothetical protein